MISLDKVKKNKLVYVKNVEGTSELTKRIMEMGITKGVKIIIKNFAPLGDPIEIQLRGFRLSIRKKDAQKILIY